MKTPSKFQLLLGARVAAWVAIIACSLATLHMHCSAPEPGQVHGFGAGPGFTQQNNGSVTQLANSGSTTFTNVQPWTTTGSGGANDNIALTGTASVFSYTGAGVATFSGFANVWTGRFLLGENNSSSNVTLPHNVTSTAANRLSLPTLVDWTCLPNASWTQMYVAGSTNRWLVFPGSACFSSTHPATASAAAAGESEQWDGAAWQNRANNGNDYRGAVLGWQFECTQASGGSEYQTSLTGTGATIGTIAGAGRLGICDVQTGTTNTGAARLAHSGFSFPLSSLSAFYFQGVLGVPTLSTNVEEYALAYGCRDTSGTVDQAYGCYFLYDRGNVATGGCNTSNLSKWEVVCADNSARTRLLLDGSAQNGACAGGAITTVDSAVAALTLPNTNIYNLEIVGSPSSVAFKINGTTRATITTNIPSDVSRYCGDSIAMIKSAGTTNRSAYLDRLAAVVQQSSARSP